jgi:polyvinyl alcohol dehydrogenase (cytochrome)
MLHRRLTMAVVTAVLTAIVSGPAASATQSGGWTMGGHDYANSRSNPAETTISTSNANQLTPKWTLATQGDVSATPAVVAGAVYVPDWGGYFYKLDAASGKVIWSHQISEYTGTAGAISRTSPAVVGRTVYIGEQNGSHLMAIDTDTGRLQWSTRLDPHQAAILTQSPIVHDGVIYQGVSSNEEQLAGDPSYPCCTFRGSFVAVRADTGQVLWRTYTVPDNGGEPGGYSGNAIWGSTPALDAEHHTVYITTGNNYDVPQSVNDCQDAGHPASECLDPDDYIDAILALDTRDGHIKWAAGAKEFDSFNTGCFTGPPPNNCPTNLGNDWDFAQGAQLFSVRTPGGGERLLVGAGQKSGEYWAVDARTGKIVWSAAVAPGSADGGMMFGSATDGKRIYVAEVNAGNQPYTLPNGQTITWGSWAALDPATGKIIWQVGDPEQGHDMGALTVANGVLYAPSLTGHLYAIDAATGDVRWSFQTPGASVAGPSVTGGTVFWGDGYHNFLGGPTHANVLYAFAAPGTSPQ